MFKHGSMLSSSLSLIRKHENGEGVIVGTVADTDTVAVVVVKKVIIDINVKTVEVVDVSDTDIVVMAVL